MAENTQDQTQYANPETGEVPIAPKPDTFSGAPVTWGTPEMYNRPAAPPSPGITPDQLAAMGVPSNPYPAPEPPPPSPATLALLAAANQGAPPNTPLSQTGYAGQQIGSAESRKGTIAREAENLSKGQEEIMRINREAEAEQ